MSKRNCRQYFTMPRLWHASRSARIVVWQSFKYGSWHARWKRCSEGSMASLPPLGSKATWTISRRFLSSSRVGSSLTSSRTVGATDPKICSPSTMAFFKRRSASQNSLVVLVLALDAAMSGFASFLLTFARELPLPCALALPCAVSTVARLDLSPLLNWTIDCSISRPSSWRDACAFSSCVCAIASVGLRTRSSNSWVKPWSCDSLSEIELHDTCYMCKHTIQYRIWSL